MANESLSALLDGECSPEEMDRLLDQMERDPQLKAAWSQLCLSRELREGTRVLPGQPCICAGVMGRLDESSVPAAGKVVEIAPRQTRPQPTPRRFDWRPLSGWAVAASVAVVAVVMNLGGDDRAAAEAGGASTMPQISSPVSVPLVNRRPRNLQAVSLTPDQQAVDEDLRNYLIEHSSTLAERGMGGTLSYARFAAYNEDRSQAAPQAQPAVASPSEQR